MAEPAAAAEPVADSTVEPVAEPVVAPEPVAVPPLPRSKWQSLPKRGATGNRRDFVRNVAFPL